MKKLVKKLSIPQIAILLGALSLIIVYLFTKYVDNNPNSALTSAVSNKVTSVIDRMEQKRDRVETNKSTVISGIDPDEYSKVLKALDLKEKDIIALTNIKGKLQDSLRISNLSRDAANNKLWEWENKKPSGSIIKASMSEKDSVLHTDIDVKLNTTDFVDRGGLFKKDKYYTDFYSPDQNIKINGAQTYRKETIIRPKRLGVGLQAGYGISNDLKPSIYVGVGLSYNILTL